MAAEPPVGPGRAGGIRWFGRGNAGGIRWLGPGRTGGIRWLGPWPCQQDPVVGAYPRRLFRSILSAL